MNNNVFINNYENNIFFKLVDYVVDNFNYYTINLIFSDDYILEKYQKKLVYEYSSFSEEYNNKISSLDAKIKEINSSIAKKKDEFEKFKNKVETSFSKELNSIIEIFSTENSIDMILDKSNLLMARKELNITQKIINLFNENVKEINIK